MNSYLLYTFFPSAYIISVHFDFYVFAAQVQLIYDIIPTNNTSQISIVASILLYISTLTSTIYKNNSTQDSTEFKKKNVGNWLLAKTKVVFLIKNL